MIRTRHCAKAVAVDFLATGNDYMRCDQPIGWWASWFTDRCRQHRQPKVMGVGGYYVYLGDRAPATRRADRDGGGR